MKKSTTKEELLKQDHIRAKVEERAYHIAQSEGFPHGRDVIHWLKAEELVVVEFLGKELKSAVATAKKITGKKAPGTEAKTAPKPVAKAAAKPAAKTSPSTNGKAASKPPAKAPAKAASKPAAAKAASKPAAKKAPAKKGK